MIHNSRQLKDLVRNLSKETNIEAHVLIRKYIMERFLERASLSQYRDQFVLKGGLLVSAFVGAEARATMDIDTTIKGLPVTIEDMTRILKEICSIDLEDNISFRIKSASQIMDEADYSGLRFAMEAYLDGSITPLKIDISTGDSITPREILYSYKLMFEDRSISIMTYPIETVLAEKLETLVARSVTNTRMRDFYDIHILLHSEKLGFDPATLQKALIATSSQRGTMEVMNEAEKVLSALTDSPLMQDLWKNYQRKFPYAADYSWHDVMKSARSLSYAAGLSVEKPSELDKPSGKITVYPWATREQLDEICAGLHDHLTEDQIVVYAKPEFSGSQMNAIRYAIKNGLTAEQLQVLANPAFDSVQMDVIRTGFQSGMTMEQVAAFADPNTSSQKMLDQYYKIQQSREQLSEPTPAPDYGSVPELELE